MLQLVRKEDCCGCQACAQVCPKNCITMQSDDEGFWYPHIDTVSCVDCGLCEKVCPCIKPHEDQPAGEPDTYAARSHENDLRLSSSSGGVFTLLARQVLREQGIVYGAAMTSVTEVRHIRVCGEDELPLLRGSKYVQSHIGQTYLQVREDLNLGRTVLFSGTPCQIEGLHSFLGKDYRNLICTDIVCHGVPSPMVWQKYVHYREERAKSPAVRASFRHKRYGWKEYSVVFRFADNSVYASSFGQDPFMQAYLHDLCLRPSCYECRFKKRSRISDITLADFWGVEHACPQMDDNRGTSLVMAHSEKGTRMIHAIFADMDYQQVDFSCAIRGNPSMVTAAEKPEDRDRFLQDIQRQSFRKAVRRYVKSRPTVKSLARSVLRQLGLKKPVDASLP